MLLNRAIAPLTFIIGPNGETQRVKSENVFSERLKNWVGKRYVGCDLIKKPDMRSFTRFHPMIEENL